MLIFIHTHTHTLVRRAMASTSNHLIILSTLEALHTRIARLEARREDLNPRSVYTSDSNPEAGENTDESVNPPPLYFPAQGDIEFIHIDERTAENTRTVPKQYYRREIRRGGRAVYIPISIVTSYNTWSVTEYRCFDIDDSTRERYMLFKENIYEKRSS